MSMKCGEADAAKRLPLPKPGDEVVISGISGRFPESENLTRLKENLFNKRDLMTDDERRWKFEDPDIPQSTGKIQNIEKFDARFFGIDPQEGQAMDPMGRMLLEHAYEAIIDAGVNPAQLRGTNTGVFVASTWSEAQLDLMYETNQAGGLGISGCSCSMLANRISQWLGTIGPSYSVDSACSSSLFATDQAYRAIRTGQCDAALVGASQLCLNPLMSMQFSLLGMLSPDGRCKSFDDDANGYCRSEAVCIIYLQKAKDAKRIYANVVYTKTNSNGFTEQGITFPPSEMQSALLEQFYNECRVPPTSVAFIEAHGTGTKVGDPEEVKALDRVFCPGRTTPLRIGSIKSNLGHTEAASGCSSIAKVIIAMESGYIPPNLHYNRPPETIEALVDGRIEVITELTPWDGGYVGVNSFGFGGANAHVLLKSNPKKKINSGAPNDDLPRLVVVSGRTMEAVTTLLDDIESRPVDVEYVSLFHGIHAEEIPGHSYRGYTIVPSLGLQNGGIRDVRYCPPAKRPIWFMFCGMGSSWAGIGGALLKFPVFVKAAEKCDTALKSCGLDIINILTTNDPKIFDNIVNSFVAIATIQIGLVDVLDSIGIVPDNIIGHSIGEFGCAYADGCLTAEEIVLAAYDYGLASKTKTIHRSLVVIESGKVELQSSRSSGVEITRSHTNWSLSFTKRYNATKKVIIKLQLDYGSREMLNVQPIPFKLRETIKKKDDIAVREELWQGCNNAMADSKLSAYLQKLIPDLRPGNKKWLLSAPCKKCTTSSARSFSPEYDTSDTLNPNPFDEILHAVQNNAIVIEIAPHGLLRTMLRRSLSEEVARTVSVNSRNEDAIKLLLQAIGKMYELGLHPKLTNLYPDVQHPVSRGTPMISPLLRWEHTKDWYIPKPIKQEKIDSGKRVVQISNSNYKFGWMVGHVIDGRNLVPGTAYLVLVWETLALIIGELCDKISVVFEDVSFDRATTIPKQGSVEFVIMIQKGSGRFEVAEGNTPVVTGFIRVTSNPARERVTTEVSTDDDDQLDLTNKDIYKELRLRGYQYEGVFCALEAATLDGSKGSITWKQNWVAFMDGMLQLELLGMSTRSLLVPKSIQKLVIDTTEHLIQLRTLRDHNEVLPVQVHKDLGIVVSGGVEIRGLKLSAIARKKSAQYPVVEDFKFVAHRDHAQMGLDEITRIATHIALENHSGTQIKTIELIGYDTDRSPENLTSPLIQKILGDSPLVQANVNIIAPARALPHGALPSTIQVSESKKLTTESNALLVIGHGLLANKDNIALTHLQAAMNESGFLLAREPLNRKDDSFSTIQRENLNIILEKRTDKELIFLLRKKPKIFGMIEVIQINNDKFSWLSKLQAALKKETEQSHTRSSRILLVSANDSDSGLLGLVNCLRKEPGGEIVQGLLIQDSKAPKFSLINPLYSEQIHLGLALNVLRPGKLWGSYRFFAMNPLLPRPVYHLSISQETRGDLSSLKWVEGKIQPSIDHGDIIQVHYSSMNFRDVMITSGKLAPEIDMKKGELHNDYLGFDYSGRDVIGRAVMGMVCGGAFSNICVPDSELLWLVPDGWTLEDAATIPLVYATAYMALKVKAKIKKGDKVLIHAGSGGVGQAAITLALHEGCEVFTTVGTPEKRALIKHHFPQIDNDHIGNSRDASFEQLFLRKTQGQGVDIVLNSLAEEKLQASLRCLRKGGRFVDIGKSDYAANNSLGMEIFLKGISYHCFYLEKMILSSSSVQKAELAAMLAEGLKSGVVKPLVRTVFAMDQTEVAFRYMAAGKHIGKVILKIRDENTGHQVPLPLGLPRYYCSADGTILILGGLGGFGLELADWLVNRGARKLVLTSRKGITTGYQRLRVNIWKSYGVTITIIVGKDVSMHEGCEYILKEAAAIGPVDAIFNLAVVLQDSLCENQTTQSFEESFRVKAWATKQLDRLSRTLCPRLRQFVVFSSVSCGRGNAGQTNYGMSNSVMERICERRVAENLPGLAIQWGAVGDAGLVAEMQVSEKEIVIGGTLPQKISSCLEVLDSFLLQNSPVVSSMVLADKTAAGDEPKNIVHAVTSIMGLKNLKTISLHSSLMELGLDSMMAIEMKMTLEREFEIFLTLEDIRGLTLVELNKMSLKEAEEDDSRANMAMHETDDSNSVKLFTKILNTDKMIKDVCTPLVMGTENKGREVFVLPGIDETHMVFKSLAYKLNSPTTCLQLVTTSMGATWINDMADHLIPHIKDRSRGRREFLIAAYSFGTLVAIELARRLESEGLSGRLVLFDGSPVYLKALINQHFNATTDDELQSNLLLGMADILAPYMSMKLAADLQSRKTWEEKLAAFTKNMPESLSPEDQTAVCSSVYSRLKAIQTYDTSVLSPLKTPIILLRPKIESVPSMSEDYDLGLLTREKVEVRYVEGDRVTMLDDDDCATAINGELLQDTIPKKA